MKLFGYKVKLHMKSGAVLEGYVTKLTKRFDFGNLACLEWVGDMPFYLRLDDISAITSKRVINWRRLFQ